ncbi:betaine--homocysteine S-methyltransferase [Woeseiaceae bacterium]|nr:betaine--homocysteine S-methyltransferase [Woeseiaceae bacterium]
MLNKSIIKQLIDKKGYLIADGATGTNLFSMGLESGYPPELWNIEAPQNVAENHEKFIQAGADIILTNSFGANRHRLKLHKAENKTYEINYAAAEIAKNVTNNSKRNILVAGSVGPTGELIIPLGQLTKEDTIETFYEQIKGLKDGGIDLIWIETMSAEEEMECAIIAAKKNNLPIICTYSFDTHGKSMMGLEPKSLARLAEKYYPDVIGYGANCGIGASELIGTIICLANERINEDMLLIAKGNCGIPEFIEGKIAYTGTPELMAEYASLARAIGADIIGGCCGTKYEHIVAMRDALRNKSQSQIIDLDAITQSLGKMSAGNTALIDGYLNPNKKIKPSVKKKMRRRKKRPD